MISHARTADGADIAWSFLGEGPALLLIAGQASSHQGWLSIVPELARHFRVILFDHRGVGDSTEVGIAHASTRTFATDALTVLDAAGAQRAHVYGHSMGGRIGQWLAIDHPERVDRLVLACTSGGASRQVPRDPDATAALVSGRPDLLAPFFFGEEFRATNPDIVERFFHIRASRPALRAHFAASRDHDAWGELSRIEAPTLVVHGEADRITPVANARMLAESIRGARLDVVPGGHHAVHLESTALQRTVVNFLAER